MSSDVRSPMVGCAAAHHDLFTSPPLTLPLRCLRLHFLDESRAGAPYVSSTADFGLDALTAVVVPEFCEGGAST
jgi:hypothetical protein